MAAFDLQRFVAAQDGVYHQVLAELRAGRKTSHWMWFIFPQLRGLGHSAMAVRYGIEDRREAEAYLAHPVLGGRLRECAGLVLAVEDRSVHAIFGSPDDVKLRSSMTLFDAVEGNGVFRQVLHRYFAGNGDEQTMRLLGA